VDPVPDPLLFFSGSAGNRTRASGSVAKNCPPAVEEYLHPTTANISSQSDHAGYFGIGCKDKNGYSIMRREVVGVKEEGSGGSLR
jgi:hypothetical protein